MGTEKDQTAIDFLECADGLKCFTQELFDYAP